MITFPELVIAIAAGVAVGMVSASLACDAINDLRNWLKYRRE